MVAVAVVFVPPVGTVVVVWSVVVDLVVVVRVEREVPDRVLVVPVSYFYHFLSAAVANKGGQGMGSGKGTNNASSASQYTGSCGDKGCCTRTCPR